MAYDKALASSVRKVLATRRNVTEKPMFGALSFLVRGNTCCGITGDELMVRVDPARYESALSRRHAREMDFTGRPLRGYVYVAQGGLRSTDALRGWVDQGLAFARSLPPK